MSTPSAYAIRSYLNGTEITLNCPYKHMSFEDYRHSVSKFSLTLENPSFVPTEGMELHILLAVGGRTVFIGNLVDVSEKKHDNGIVLDYEIEAADRKYRLLKSVVPFDEYVGLDTDILDDLINNAYPDLSDVYDFATDVNNLADNLDLPVNDDNLLDMLDDLAEQAGADYSFGTDAGQVLIDFEGSGWGSLLTDDEYARGNHGYHLYNGGGATELSGSIASSGGNPDQCVKWVDTGGGTVSSGNTLCLIEINLGAEFGVNTITFDYRVSGSSDIGLICATNGATQAITGTGAWHSASFPINADHETVSFGFRALANLNLNSVALDLRFDNIAIGTDAAPPDSNPKDTLEWDSSPPASNFDLDIDLGSEFGANFDLNLGGWDSYNAVIVTGGSEAISVDWTYPASGYQKQINLEKQVKDLVVYKNTGDDTTPSWTAQTLGKWGVDDIGTKDVIYDEQDAWLLFDSEPDYLRRSIRITGSIKKPIRVLVSNAPDGVPIYATTVYNANATTEEAAFNIGSAFLAKRNLIRHLEFETLHPGLKVGQTIGVNDTSRGLSEQLIIQHIRTTWIGASGHAKFEVECGDEEFSDASNYIALNDKRSREKAPPVPIGTTTYAALLNDLGEPLLNDLGDIIYAPV